MSEDKKHDWLYTHRKNAERVVNISYALLDLSHAFRMVGNETIASELKYYAVSLEKAQKGMRDSVSTSIDQAYKQAQDMSATILNATLTGIKLGQEEYDD